MNKEASDWAAALAGTNVKVIDAACLSVPVVHVWEV